jgi:hypothetical protein
MDFPIRLWDNTIVSLPARFVNALRRVPRHLPTLYLDLHRDEWVQPVTKVLMERTTPVCVDTIVADQSRTRDDFACEPVKKFFSASAPLQFTGRCLVGEINFVGWFLGLAWVPCVRELHLISEDTEETAAVS